ncbi:MULTISPECIES: hypothetical protein [unclassified Streptomyces]|uniref:hypothetical protein n=1 Tax=unclassified Streptomyces TaxID=2593676 RepID=UPI0023666FEC|nr:MULTISPECIES: hypothetical protein [unclassified Streptomyces]MDF3141505.1 hypothetical protein [Streptomyces sp. T21Q-yed]WDF45014.1 hypothetical protein PBV52_50845 [Streptomyces sp. T12]
MGSHRKQDLWVLDTVWETAKARAKDVDHMPLGTVLDHLLREYAAGRIPLDLPQDADRGPGRSAKGAGVDPDNWKAATERAEADGLSGSRVAELLLTAYAAGHLELAVSVRVKKRPRRMAS